MADVRSMLRAERESRRITHPHASYTSTGALLCNLCDVTIKSDKAWRTHLHSTEHNIRSGRPKEVPPTAASTGKKRKAVEFDDVPVTERKKARGSASDKYPTPDHDEPDQQRSTTNLSPAAEDISSTVKDDSHAANPTTPTNIAEDEVNKADLEALERDLAAMEQEVTAEDRHSALTAITAAPTISAPAIAKGEELTKDEDSPAARRSKRDVENEEDREDAARALEEEFAEMESLQERAKRLRDRREALRTGVSQPQLAPDVGSKPDEPGEPGEPGQPVDNDDEDDDDADDDDADDDSEYDDWTFGPR